MSTKKVLIFIHLHKTGGTTLRRILEKNYKKDERLLVNWKVPKKKLRSFKKEKKFPYKCVYGHNSMGFHKYLPKDCEYKYVILLREPISRVKSLIRFIKNRSPLYFLLYIIMGDKKNYKFLKEMKTKKIDEIFNDADDVFFNKVNNAQTRQVLINPDLFNIFRKRKTIKKNDLKKAIENINREDVMVGITKEFDMFLNMLKRDFGLINIKYSKRNKSKKDIKFTDKEEALFKNNNKYDKELYKVAKRKFYRELKKYPGIKKETEEFKKENKEYNRKYRLILDGVEFFERGVTFIRKIFIKKKK